MLYGMGLQQQLKYQTLSPNKNTKLNDDQYSKNRYNESSMSGMNT